MKVLLIIFAVATLLATKTNGQNAPAINWQLVHPIHHVPSFFQDFPFLDNLFDSYDPFPFPEPVQEGRNATRNQYPYQVALVLNRTDGLGFCGGSLISNQWILTAAHCIDRVVGGTAILGGWDLRNAAEAGQSRFLITNFHVHPGWNGLRLADDVGLIQLPTPVTFNANIQAIRLANLRQVPSTYVNQLGLMSGWGRGFFSNPGAQNLRFSQFHNILNPPCRIAYPNLIESGQFCSVSTEPTGVNCPGDAGGPLVVIEADNNPTQIGITSFISGLGCTAIRPGTFTRLNFYLRWISQVTNIVIAPDFTF